MNRWWTYQKERFPLAVYAPLVAVFAGGAVVHVRLLRGAGTPSWPALGAAFVLALLFFLLLRIADEFKDVEKDRQYRPERPVPRGLVSLTELGVVGAGAAAIQLGTALWMGVPVAAVLAGAWAYFGLMSAEFFVGDWLEERMGLYMASHMVITPAIALVASACDWAAAGAAFPSAFGWFLGASYLNGMVLEVGRKIYAPEDEREGVETYSKAWGRTPAVVVWVLAIAFSGILTLAAAMQVEAGQAALVVLVLAGIGVGVVTWRFFLLPVSDRASALETTSGLWLLISYGTMGLLPLVV